MKEESRSVRGLPVPQLLLELIVQGRWHQLEQSALAAAVMFETDPLIVLPSVEKMRKESRFEIADQGEFLFIARGSKDSRAAALPWLDIEKAFFIAVNRNAGDDVAIALDFRPSRSEPRVVASSCQEHSRGTPWREVAPSFVDFATRLGL